MKLIFRGGAQEVGRSCIELRTGGDRYLLDCGVKFKEDGFAYPKGLLDVPGVDGVFITHAHLDHSGGLPFFEHKQLKGPIFCTSQTKILTKILLKDSFEVARIRHLHPAFSKVDLKEVKKDIRVVRFDKKFTHRKVGVTFYNAGHIPGSASILIEAEGKRLLYTGDMNLAQTMIMKEVIPDYGGPIDILITESTYGYRDLPDREALAQRFLDKVEQVLAQGGSVLIPVFAVGRAQEVLQILSLGEFKAPIYFDGMAKRITRHILSNPSKYVKHKERLAEMFYEVVHLVKNREERDRVAQRQGIFVTTSGMLQGGPVLHYLKHLWHDTKSAVLLTGYQCKRTNGRELLDHGFVYMKGWRTKVHCQVEKYDFSGHSDLTQLKQYIECVNPKILIVQHGDPTSVVHLTSWAERSLGCDVHGPRVLDEIDC
ncbi:MBL fold metallo-hydrolase [Candidatus Woesearchaeota archaeon]|nr:MBL fold metallo-hydrolase [Candidatus Woesearchaeota archaeon]